MGGMDTFVVRIWVSPPDEGAEGTALRGVMERVRSGESRDFRDALELVDRLQELVAEARAGSGRLPPERPAATSPQRGGGS